MVASRQFQRAARIKLGFRPRPALVWTFSTHRAVLHARDGAPQLGRAVDHGADVGHRRAELGRPLPVVLRHERRVPTLPPAVGGAAEGEEQQEERGEAAAVRAQ